MPFQNCLARMFTASAIERDAPAASGVYGLSNPSEWIYIGEADNIQARLREHFEETRRNPRGSLPTGFSFELCSAGNRIARQNRLIVELGPSRNGRQEQRGPARG